MAKPKMVEIHEQLHEDLMCINALLSDTYDFSGKGGVCKRCGELSQMNAGLSSMRLKHAPDCKVGDAIKNMRRIEALIGRTKGGTQR